MCCAAIHLFMWAPLLHLYILISVSNLLGGGYQQWNMILVFWIKVDVVKKLPARQLWRLLRLVGYHMAPDSLLQDPFTLHALNIMVSVILSTYIELHNRCNFCFNDRIQFKNLLKSFYPSFHPLCLFSLFSKVPIIFLSLSYFYQRASVSFYQ